MKMSRAAPLAISLVLALAGGCTSDATTPLGLQHDTQPAADQPSVTHEGNATVYRGPSALIVAQKVASEMDAKGDHKLSAFLASPAVSPAVPSTADDSRGIAPSTNQPSFSFSNVEPSPTTTPNAIIYSSSTGIFINGSTATVVSSVTYFGNVATSDQSYEVRDLQGAVISPMRTVSNRGEGDHYTCVGSWIPCSFTFKLVTTTQVALGKSCDRAITATGNHRAEFYTATLNILPAMTWGSTFSSDAQVSANNGACPPPPPPTPPASTPPAGGGDGSTPPSTPPSQPEPPTYVPPYYSPKPGNWVCILDRDLDYQTYTCHWVEYNDTRFPAGGSALSSARGSSTASFASGGKLPSVFVVVSDEVPAGTMAVLDRHKQGPYKNVLLVPSASFRPAELVRAMRYVYASLAADGDTPPKEFSALLQGTVNDADVSVTERDYAATFTTMLAKAKKGDAGKYGVRPILEIQLGEAKSK
jgi:hypothetical protein